MREKNAWYCWPQVMSVQSVAECLAGVGGEGLGVVGIVEAQGDALHRIAKSGEVLGEGKGNEKVRRDRHLRGLIDADDLRFLGQDDAFEAFQRLGVHLLHVGRIEIGDGFFDLRLGVGGEEEAALCFILFGGVHGEQNRLNISSSGVRMSSMRMASISL